jgi:hypothetical protein
MSNPRPSDSDRLRAHLDSLKAAGAVPMTPEEILSGQSQGGVPRPAFLKDDEGDDTVEFVGSGKDLPHG